MRFKFLALGLVLLLAGCTTLQVVSYEKAELSGVGAGELKLESLHGTGSGWDVLIKEFERYPEVQDDLAKLGRSLVCQPSGEFLPKVRTTGAVIGGLINVAAQALQGRIDGIVASSMASYSAAGIVKPDDLKQVPCLVVTRWLPGPATGPQLGMVAILQFDHAQVPLASTSTAAFLFRPVYLRMLNSVAATRKDTPAVVDIAVALSIHALAEPDLGIERFASAGGSVVTTPQVAIGPARAEEHSGRANDRPLRSYTASTPVTYPKSRGSLLLKVAIAEQGFTGFGDKDTAKAAIAALKEALGPVIEAHYTKN